MTNLVVPKWGLTMESATVSAWLVQNGDLVETGQPIVEIATDKVENEVEAPASGQIHILVHAGTDVIPGEVIAQIEAIK